MTYFFSETTVADLGIRASIARAAQRALAAHRASRERRRMREAYRNLLDCQDHLLADAGLDRAEIVAAFVECGGRRL